MVFLDDDELVKEVWIPRMITIILDLHGLSLVGTQSIRLSRKELDELRQSLQKRGIPVLAGNTPYELFRVKKEGYKCVAYTSGKLTYSTSHDLDNILDRKPPSLEDTQYEISGGTDEAGKGEWFGPLVVAIALLTPTQLDLARGLGIKDSKLLSTQQVMRMATRIRGEGVDHSIQVLPPPRYNKVYQEYQDNGKTLNDILAWSHAQLIEKYYSKHSMRKVHIVIDAFDELKLSKTLTKPPSGWVIKQRTRGERAVPVAVASILARDRFLHEVQDLEEQHGVRLFRSNPTSISKDLLPQVAKMHFSNVRRAYEH